MKSNFIFLQGRYQTGSRRARRRRRGYNAPAMLTVVLFLAAAAASRPHNEERDLLDRRLAAVRRHLPDGAQPAVDAALVNGLADAALLRRGTVTARPLVEGGPSEIVLDVVAFGRFTSIETFVRQLAESARLIDVENLALSATPEDTIRVTASLRLPYWPAGARLPPPPEGAAERAKGMPRNMADAFVRDQAVLLAKTEAITSLRRSRRSPRLFLAELAAIVQDRPVVLTEISWGNELFVVRGYSMGEGPTRELERRFERGYFRISEFLMARFGGCRRFEARGRSPLAGSEVALPLAQDDPFRQDEAPCKVDRDPAGTDTLRASGARVKTAPGPLTIRARDIDATDLFLVLHEITGQGFVVDESIRRRLDVELVGVTFEEALAALAKAGLHVGPGPIRRVSTSPLPAAAAAATGADVGPPLPDDVRVSLTLKRAPVRDVLGIIAQAEPSLGASATPGTLGYVSVWARAADVRALRARVLQSAALVETVAEEGRRTLVRTTAPNDPAMPILPAASPRRLLLHAGDLSPDDFELAAVAGDSSGSWRAFAYSPAGSLHRYIAGDRLTDAVVRSIEPTAAILETDDGPIWSRLP
jgi:hypothetical protein